MQDPRSTSTLDLVVNEQQVHNMSQIDLSRPGDNSSTQQSQTQNDHRDRSETFSFQQIREWPGRLKDSLSSKVEEAKAKSETKTEFVVEILHAFSGLVIWVLCFICTIIVPVILFFIGLVNLDNCKDKPPLPYLVFATGFVMTASNLFNLALAIDLPILSNHQILTNDIKNTIASILNIIFNCVVAFLYIISAYMVYTVKRGGKTNTSAATGANDSGASEIRDDTEFQETPSEPQSMECSALLYHFTFWFITLTLSFFVVLSLIAAAFYAYNKYRLAIIRGSTPRSQTNSTNNANVNTNPANIYATNGV